MLVFSTLSSPYCEVLAEEDMVDLGVNVSLEGWKLKLERGADRAAVSVGLAMVRDSWGAKGRMC
jgi:hypothetical protein